MPADHCILSIVVPTYNEADNVPELLRLLENTLGRSGWEVIFVDDDSPDQTAEIVRDISRQDRRVRGLHRLGRRGLSSACIEGMLASCGEFIAVMDADLQHDETILPTMLQKCSASGADIVIATRYAHGGSTGEWAASRRRLSRMATSISRKLIDARVTDPLSGFFMIRRQLFQSLAPRLSGIGFKILLDILITARSTPLRLEEVPYTFRSRLKGASKLDRFVVWEFGMLLADKLAGRIMPVHFVAFSLIGAFGVLVHLAVLSLLFNGFGISFMIAQTTAALTAMTFNYSLNNELTYRDRRLRKGKWFKGLAVFIICCSIGILANVGIATYLFEAHQRWLLAGLAGTMIGAVWNYAATRFYAWR